MMKTIHITTQNQPKDKKDCTEFINNIISTYKTDTTIVFTKGEYHFYSKCCTKEEYILSNTDIEEYKNIGIKIKDAKNVCINFNDSRLIFHGPMQPFTIDGCNNVTLEGFSIDWEIPLSAEGTIEEIGHNFLDVLIDSSLYPYKVENNQLVFMGEDWEEPLWNWGHTEFDSVTKRVTPYSGSALSPKSVEERGNIIRMYGQFKGNSKVGNVVVLRHSGRRHAGIFCVNSKNLAMNHIHIFMTGGLGILCQFCENIEFSHIQFKANEARGRKIVCAHDDGIHLSNNRGNIKIENCYFNGLMDDSINIHGTCVRIKQIIDDYTLRCEFVEKQAKGFDNWAIENDEVSFINHLHMNSIGKGTVVDFNLDNIETFTIIFNKRVPGDLQVGDCLENISNTASFICKNNFIGSNRARGILVSTPKSVIIENNFFQTAGSAILIAGDANQWFESGSCEDVIIKNNMFASECLTSYYQFSEAIISICPEIPEPKNELPFHCNISIVDNYFNPFDYPILYAFSTKDLVFNNNKIFRSPSYMPWHNNKHMVTLCYCQDVTIKENILTGDVLGKDVYLENTLYESVSIDKDLMIVTH